MNTCVEKKISSAVTIGCRRFRLIGSLSAVLLVLFLSLSTLLVSPLPVDASPAATTTVRVKTSLGTFDIELYDNAAPLTVANFLNYVHSGAYSNSFVHRNVRDFITQFGGYYVEVPSVLKIPASSPVINEFSFDRSNLRGTVAMAKLGDDPDSATSQWFVNLNDNGANLDYQNGGFTVFGKISSAGMVIIDSMSDLRIVDLGSPFAAIPVLQSFNGSDVRFTDLVMVESISVVHPELEQQPSDRVFAYLESIYPQFISPSGGSSLSAAGYYFRYYPDQDAYVATAAGTVYYFGPASDNQILDLGSLEDWVVSATSAGF